MLESLTGLITLPAAVDVKMDSFVLEDKSSFKMLGLGLGALTLSVLIKLPPRKLDA